MQRSAGAPATHAGANFQFLDQACARAQASTTRKGEVDPTQLEWFRAELPVLASEVSEEMLGAITKDHTPAELLGPLRRLAAAALRGCDVEVEPSALRLTKGGATPGFSGAIIYTIEHDGKELGIIKLTSLDETIKEISLDRAQRSRGITALPRVLGLGRIDRTGGHEPIGVEVMTRAPGEFIAKEAFWREASTAVRGADGAQRLDELKGLMSRIGGRVAEQHVRGADPGEVDPERVRRLLVDERDIEVDPQRLGKLLGGTLTLEEVLTDHDSFQVPKTAENLAYSIGSWFKLLERNGVEVEADLRHAAFERLRTLAPRFLEDPGPAGGTHGDLHLGQLAIDEEAITIIDRALMHLGVDEQGRGVFTTAYDHASLLVNIDYFAREAGFSAEHRTELREAYLQGYEAAGGQAPPDHALEFLELWRQLFVVCNFRGARSGWDRHVLGQMVGILEDILNRSSRA